jgi:hypothetical protein
VAVGSFMLIRRDQIVARHTRISDHAQPPMLWIALGGMLTLSGLFELIAAVA